MRRASELMDSRKFMAAMDELGMVWFAASRPAKGSTDELMAEALQAVLDMAMASPLAYGSVTKINDIIGHAEAVPMPPYLDMKPGKPRGIKALIPQEQKRHKTLADAVEFLKQPGEMEALGKALGISSEVIAEKVGKVKRKRRTKAEMAAASSEDAKTRYLSTTGKAIEKERLKKKPFNYDTATEAQVAAELDRIQLAQPTQAELLGEIVNTVIKPQFNSVAPAWDGYKHFIINLVRPDGSSITGKGDAWKAALKQAGVPFGLLEIGTKNIENKQIDVMIR